MRQLQEFLKEHFGCIAIASIVVVIAALMPFLTVFLWSKSMVPLGVPELEGYWHALYLHILIWGLGLARTYTRKSHE